MGEPGLHGKDSWDGSKEGVSLLIVFGLNMMFLECCPRVSPGLLPWKTLFLARQDIQSICRRH